MDVVQPLVLLRIDWRSGSVMRICNGGFVVFGGDTYLSEDPVFGSLVTAEALSDGSGDQVTAVQLMLKPASDISIPTLAQPNNAKSRVRAWLGESDAATGAIVGTPRLEFDGLVERMSVRVGRGARSLVIDAAARPIKLLDFFAGQAMSSAYHKRVWPGETGEDARTGLGIPVAWGAPSPPRGSVTGGGSGGGSGVGSVLQQLNVRNV